MAGVGVASHVDGTTNHAMDFIEPAPVDTVALHLNFLHESFKLSSGLDTAYDLVIGVLNGKSTVPL